MQAPARVSPGPGAPRGARNRRPWWDAAVTTTQTATLGMSDLEIAVPLALGANPFGWTADEPTSHAVLDAFIAGGGTLIDTSDSYGRRPDGLKGEESERIIGSWLAATGGRDDVLIVTKVSRHPDLQGLAPQTIARAVQGSLERLGTDRIDLYFAHYDDEDTPLAETLGVFDALITQGTIRYYGLSNYTPQRVHQVFDVVREHGFREPVCLQPEYSLMARHDYESGYAPLARHEHLGVMAYFALAAGFLTGKYDRDTDTTDLPRAALVQNYRDEPGFAVVDALREIAAGHGVQPASVALAWLLAQPTVTVPIASASRPEHVPGLLEGAGLELTDDEVAQLTKVSDGR